MMKKKSKSYPKSKCFFFCILLLLTLSGCWDWKEIKNISFVSGIGVDLDENNEKIQLSLEVMKAQQINSSGDSGQSSGNSPEEPRFMLNSVGNTVYEAIIAAGNKSSRDLKFTHNLVVILGPKIIRKGLEHYLDFFIYDTNPRPRQWIVVGGNSLEEIFKVKPKIEGVVSMAIAEFMNSDKISYAFEPISLQQFLQILMKEKQSIAIPMIEVEQSSEGDEIVLEKVAILHDRKYADELSLLEFRGAMWLLQRMNSGSVEMKKSNNEWISLRLDNSNSKITPKFEGGKAKIQANVEAEFTLIGSIDEDDHSKHNQMEKLQYQVEQLINEEITAVFKRMQSHNADIYEFTDLFFKRNYRMLQGKISYDEMFPQMILELKVNAKIRQTGRNNKILNL